MKGKLVRILEKLRVNNFIHTCQLDWKTCLEQMWKDSSCLCKRYESS